MGAKMLIGVAPAFWGTVSCARFATTGALLAPMASVAVAVALLPAGSDTVNANVELS